MGRGHKKRPANGYQTEQACLPLSYPLQLTLNPAHCLLKNLFRNVEILKNCIIASRIALIQG